MNVIILSESQNLYTTNRFIEELKQLNFTPLVIHPYELNSDDINKLNKSNTLFAINRISGVRMDNYDLKLARLLELNKIKVFNPSIPSLMLRDKASQYLFFKEYKYNLIPTYSCRGEGYPRLLDRLKEGIFIVKPENGNGGRGISIANNKLELLSLLKNHYKIKDQKYIIQPLIEDFREFRVLLTKKNTFAVIEKFNTETKLRNLSRPNSSAKLLDETSALFKRLVSTSKDILQKSKFEILGIDFILTEKNDQLFPLEINLCAGLKYSEQLTKKNLAKEILSDFLAEVLEV